MFAVNYIKYGCSSSRTTPGVITTQELHNGGKNCFSYYSRQGEKRQFKKTNQKPTLCTCRLFLLKQIFQYISKFKRQQRDKLEPTTT